MKHLTILFLTACLFNLGAPWAAAGVVSCPGGEELEAPFADRKFSSAQEEFSARVKLQRIRYNCDMGPTDFIQVRAGLLDRNGDPLPFDGRNSREFEAHLLDSNGRVIRSAHSLTPAFLELRVKDGEGAAAVLILVEGFPPQSIPLDR